MDKQQFARAHPQYGYGPSASDSPDAQLEIDRLRAAEFPHMRDGVYLDHAGATMYSTAQLERVFAELRGAALGNPHSGHSGSESTAARMARVKRQVLGFFRASADEYALVFTAGATAALKLVGESFPWRGAESTFAHAVDAHTSVLGIRGYAAKHGAAISCVSLNDMARMENESRVPADVIAVGNSDCDDDGDAPLSLFAFPAECNFSGVRHSLALVQRVQDGALNRSAEQRRWLVLLDAAKFVGTHQLDLSACKPDFVVLSFYKMFGYPTGLGALLARKSALRMLQKEYYGGGTVQSILATQHLAIPRGMSPSGADSSVTNDAARFADGTQSFLSILALRHGFEQLEKLGMARIEAHTAALTALLHSRLASMKHWNGAPICEIYGNHTHSADPARIAEKQGSIVACNFLRPDGSYVGYSEVSKLAAIHNIQLRTGCFCNPGACQAYLRLEDSDLLAGIEAGHVCGDDMDLLDGRPTGAVRLSIGYMTSYEDVTAFTDFAAKYFVSSEEPVLADGVDIAAARVKNGSEGSTRVRVRKITLFPIKSCSGMVVNAWPVGARGLLFDREWAIVDVVTNKALSLKELPELCFVRPHVDLKQQTLTISFQAYQDRQNVDAGGNSYSSPDTFVLSLTHTDSRNLHSMRNKDTLDAVRDMRVCTDACKGRDVGAEVSQWLSERLKRQCTLMRVTPSHLRDSQASATKSRSSSSHARAINSPTGNATSDPESSITSVTESAYNKIGFANQAQYLLMSRASIADLNTALRAAGALEVDEDAFRANLIVDGCEAFEEDTWTRLRIGDDPDDEVGKGVAFTVSGPCSRCSMINVNPKTGAFSRAPLQTLARYRRERSSIFFGQFLTRASQNAGATIPLAWLRVDDSVVVARDSQETIP